MKVPEIYHPTFTCPHCGVHSQFSWNEIKRSAKDGIFQPHYACFAICSNCDAVNLWVDKKMIFPRATSAPVAHHLLPECCKNYYEEARLIAEDSPRAAAALLRLTIEKLVGELGAKEKNLNKAIGELVQKGLPPGIQKAFDACRVIGNEAVHTGEILGDDTTKTTMTLFKLVNLIVKKMIEEPQELEDIYDLIPEEKKAGIKQRDGKKSN